jgi:hypothetical protein
MNPKEIGSRYHLERFLIDGYPLLENKEGLRGI